MSIIQQHTSSTLSDAWRTIDIDALTEDSSVNFDTATLRPSQPDVSEAEVRQLAGQVRQLLRGGDAEGALRGGLETPVYSGADAAKVGQPACPSTSLVLILCRVQDAHLQTIIEVLQSIKASDMSPLLKGIYESPGGPECLDVLMKYMCVSPPPDANPRLSELTTLATTATREWPWLIPPPA